MKTLLLRFGFALVLLVAAATSTAYNALRKNKHHIHLAASDNLDREMKKIDEAVRPPIGGSDGSEGGHCRIQEPQCEAGII